MPAVFIAISSNRSPILPKVINEPSNIAKDSKRQRGVKEEFSHCFYRYTFAHHIVETQPYKLHHYHKQADEERYYK